MAIETLTVREALNRSLADALDSDPRAFLIGEDIVDPFGGTFKVTAGLSDKFGTDRIRRTPISETGIVGVAIGAALAGLRPIAEVMYMDFFTLAMDQLVNQAAFLSYMSGGQLSVPLVVRTQGGGGRASAAQHAKSLEAWFCHVPGLKFVVLSSAEDAYWLLQWAIRDPNPVIFFEPNGLYAKVGELDTSRPPPDIVAPLRARSGAHITVVTWGGTVEVVLEAADMLSGGGIEADVLILRQLAPLDYELIMESVHRTGALLVVHEAWTVGGLGAEIAAQVSQRAFTALRHPVLRLGGKHTPHPFSPILEAEMLPSVERIVNAVRGELTPHFA